MDNAGTAGRPTGAGLAGSAVKMGANAVFVLAPESIPVQEGVRDMCRAPGCPAVGKSANCPPHVESVGRFRARLSDYTECVVFRLDVPPAELFGAACADWFIRLHGMAAALEREAGGLGHTKARGLAGGSCHTFFCAPRDCAALAPGGGCRYPETTRPPMEGMGVNVFELAALGGWEMHRITRDTDPGVVPSAMLVGLVLAG
ncbi:MAG: DUF2284 domain-containing protein [Desulfatibacillaceae bacterium]